MFGFVGVVVVDVQKILSIVFVLALAASAWFMYPVMRSAIQPWNNPTVLPEEVRAAEWVDRNVPKLSHFSSDLFACEMLTAVARQVCSVGGAWELADRPNQRYAANEKVFLTNSSDEAHRLLLEYKSTYVLVADRTSFYAYGWKQPELEKFKDSRFFKLLHQDRRAFVYKVVQ